ncbi:uncharacterized protein MKK02DRAFT_33424 [Dioszegia hungarica]|uniref:Uncharacterized protein n=1 Tax=Dioszegia hungarica TaxID=4972 RepID=A0AA38HB08_9TREE|nr:uncharacterized protein MKK02DRAFT_33424 [Dioszegia hungarica]KAI9636169.1 hypothetical protein MKK02DRAFT_33424 [Dioszegia hungarica]
MPILPMYSLRSNGKRAPEYSIDAPPSYHEVSGSELYPLERITTYVVQPRWPIKAKRQVAVCPIGSSREEAIAIVHSAFPLLAAYPAQRIEILALVSVPTRRNLIGLGQQWLAHERWVIVRDEAWSALRSSPPIRLRVQIKDGPGDEAARKKRYRLHMIIAVCFILAFVAGVSAIVYLCRRTELAMDRKGDGGVGKSAVTYTLEPRWPIKGVRQDVLGVLGATKEETIAIVQEIFPHLSACPPHRVEFLSRVSSSGSAKVTNDRWASIMDEAWASFGKTPPSHLKVQIQDGPGEEAARNRRQKIQVAAGIGGAITLFLAPPFTVWLCGGMDTLGPPPGWTPPGGH